MKLLLLFAILLTCTTAFAQTEPGKTDTITYYNNSGNYYFKGNKLRYRQLEQKLMQFPQTADIFFKHKKQSTAAGFVIIAGLTSGIIALTKKSDHFFTPYTIGFIVGTGIGIPLSMQAQKPLRKAVILYNQQLRQ